MERPLAAWEGTDAANSGWVQSSTEGTGRGGRTPSFPFTNKTASTGRTQGKETGIAAVSRRNLHGWLFRAERYFTINDVDEDDRVLAASV